MAAVTLDQSLIPQAWRKPAAAVLALLVALLVIFRDTAAAMIAIWSSNETYAHAYLVLPISLWLIWRRRDRLVGIEPRPWLAAGVPMGLAAFAWLIGKLAIVNALMHFAFVAMLVLAVPLILGARATRAMLFPLLFLFFCVPFGDFLLPTLMEGTADFTVAALRLTGLPVYREGLQFMIPSGRWSVVEACSGVRYLIASVMVGSLFAYLNYVSLKRRLLFVGVSIVVPIVANWVRAYMIVMLGHLSENRIATGVDHLVYGWVFFGVVITVMFLIGSRWTEPEAPRCEVSRGDSIWGMGNRQPMAPLIAAVALGLAGGAVPHIVVAYAGQNIYGGEPRLSWPGEMRDGWRRSDIPFSSWSPRFDGASTVLRAGFQRKEDLPVGVQISYFRDQQHGRKLVTSTNVLARSEDTEWQILGVAKSASTFDGSQLTWTRTHMLGRAGLRHPRDVNVTVWQIFWVDDTFSDSGALAKLLGARNLLRGRGDDGAVLVFYTEGVPAEGGDARLASFAESNLGALRQVLINARDSR